jgi:hypothetical protein
MKNQPSSSQSSRWYREPWPWLLIAGPLLVVIASLATAVIAIKSDDGVVAGDYYKRGLLVNQRLPKIASLAPSPMASATLSADGKLTVHLANAAAGDSLRATLTHPSSATREDVVLVRNGEGDYAAVVRADRTGAWTVSFDSLPTTIVERTRRVRP